MRSAHEGWSRSARVRILETNRRISIVQAIQFLDKSAGKRGLRATPRVDDTFLNDEKGCLFLLTVAAFLNLASILLKICRVNTEDSCGWS